MKHKLFLASILYWMGVSCAFATETSTLFSESFASGQGNFTIINTNLPSTFSYIWQYDASYGMVASAYLSGTAYESESWLVSPGVDLRRCSSAYCTYMHAAKFQNGDLNRGVTVWAAVNPTEGVIISSEWTQLQVPSYPTKGTWTYYSTGQIDLSAFVGFSNVKIAIRYQSSVSAADTYEMKNFNVVGIIGDTYTITAQSENPNKGSVVGGGVYEAGASATLTATPNEGYNFSHWNDGNTSISRTITVTSNATYTAYFVQASQISISTAISIASNLSITHSYGTYGSLRTSDPSINSYYISGIVSNVNIDTTYMSATYSLTDATGTITVFRGKGLDGAAIRFFGQIQNGDSVTLLAHIQKVVYVDITIDVDGSVEETGYSTKYELVNGYLVHQNNQYVNSRGLVYRLSPDGMVSIIDACDLGDSVIIHDHLTFNGVQMPVTKINSGVLQNRPITMLKIPATITTIGDSAFFGCSQLVTVISESTTPPTAFASTFNGISNFICTLYVPAESINAYKNAVGWNTILFVEPLEETDDPSPCVIASGTCGAQGDNLTWDLTCDSVLTIRGNGAMPDYLWDNRPWYSMRNSIRSVVINDSVTSIGDFAFEGCSGLTSVTIPNSVTSIGCSAFEYCSGLTNITIPNSVTSIGDYAFSGCSNLTSPVYNAHVFAYMPTSYSGAYSIFDGIKSIAGGAFVYCSGLTSVAIPNSVTSIGDHAFQSCTSLNSIDIPNGVASIGNDAFYRCTNLTNITIPNSVTSIGSYAFCNCASLTSFFIPNSVTSIRNRTFSGCSGLTNVTIPNSVTSIGDHAFQSCLGLASVTIPNSVTSIREGAFAECNALTSIYNYSAIPQIITEDVFESIDKTTCTLYVPQESISLYQDAEGWRDFTNISSVGVDPNPCIIASGPCGVVGSDLIWELSCDSVLTISGTGAMADQLDYSLWNDKNRAIKTIVLLEGITSIGDYAFGDCINLTNIIIPNSVTSIGDYAFYYCTGLTSVAIPNSVTSIGQCAFAGACFIAEFVVASDNPSFSSYEGVLFDKSKNTLICYPSNNARDEYVIPNSVTSILSGAFGLCFNLSRITIPNSVTSIETSAFDECRKLSSIMVDSLNPIYDSRNNCNAIIETATNTLIVGCRNTIIPNTVVCIGTKAFYGCQSLISIDIPSGVISIQKDAFYNSGLKSVTIPSTVTNIGKEAFFGCRLKSITNYATTPQIIESSSYIFGYAFFYDTNCVLLVPEESIDLYQAAEGWKDFRILPIGVPCIFASSGTYGVESDSVTWNLSCDSVLTISGTGSLNKLKWYLAYNLEYIKTIILPCEITNIADSAFYAFPELTSIDLPSSVTNIGENAFAYCRALTSITNHATIPQVIDNSVFTGVNKRNCLLYVPEESVNLYKVADVWKDFRILTIGTPCIIASSGTCGAEGDNLTWELSCDSVLTISGTGAMADYSWNNSPWYENREAIKIIVLPNGITNIGNHAFADCLNLLNITIPNSVTRLGNMALFDCPKLTSIEIPNSVTSIDTMVFTACYNLLSVDVETNNPNYCSVDGVLFNKDTTTLIQFSLGRSGEYSIPTGVINIGDYAFYAAVNLTNVIIPESVIHIGEGTFISCGILSITIPNSVTSMGMSAFEDCFQLASVTIGENLTDIGDYAFSYCTALTSINNYSAMPQVICSGVFNKVDKSVCTLYVPAQSIALYQAADVWKEFIHILPIDAKPVDVTDVIVTPTETTADIAWPQVSGAYTYELVIKDQNGNVVCSQTFNAQGQLIDIVNTHARSRASRQTQSSGFQFTVIGLEKGTAYNYTIVSKDENGQVLDTQSGSFTTQSTQGINQITNYHTNKILHNGQIFILRGEKVYTLQGQEVK